MVCYTRARVAHPHLLHCVSITTRLSHSNTGYSRKPGPILLERDPRSYESLLNSSVTSRRTGWKITRCFDRSKSGAMAPTMSSGQPSWSSVCLKLWPRPGVISRVKSIRSVLLNSYCFDKENGLRDTPELKACAVLAVFSVFFLLTRVTCGPIPSYSCWTTREGR